MPPTPPLGYRGPFLYAPGIFGNLVSLPVVFLPAGPNYASSVANGTTITLTIGTTAGLTNIDWASIAALFNADSAVNGIATMVGQVGDFSVLPQYSLGNLPGGSAGMGAGQFYFAAAAPPPPAPLPVDIALFFEGVLRIPVN
jgi:hypothetical protein